MEDYEGIENLKTKEQIQDRINMHERDLNHIKEEYDHYTSVEELKKYTNHIELLNYKMMQIGKLIHELKWVLSI